MRLEINLPYNKALKINFYMKGASTWYLGNERQYGNMPILKGILFETLNGLDSMFKQLIARLSLKRE